MKRSIPRQGSLAVPDIPNPFVHELKLSFLDKLQVVLMSLTIAPIRLLLIIILLLFTWLFAAIAIAFRSKEDLKKPLSGWRFIRQFGVYLLLRLFLTYFFFKCSPTSDLVAGSVRSDGKYFAIDYVLSKGLLRPVVLFFCRAVFFVGGIHRVIQRGKQATPKEAPILLLAPHSSFLDVLPALCLGLNSVVAKKSSSEIFLFGTLTMFSQPVLVDRADPNSRANTINEIQTRSHSGGQWPQIIIFPEGTCSNRTCLISFKQGAFFPGVPVQPVCVKFPNKLDTVTWTWEGPGALTQLWLTLCQFYTRMEIEYLPVYTPSEDEKKDARLFADNVRAVMAEALNCPVTDHTYDDCRLMSKAEKLRLPAESGLIEFEKLHSKLGIKYDQVQELLVKFKEMKQTEGSKKKKVAVITYEDFCNYLHLPPSEALQQVFDLYDRDGSGTIDFREYIIGLSLVSSPANDDSSIELAFQLFDSDKKGYVTQDDLNKLLSGAFNIQQEHVEIIFSELDTHCTGEITLDEFKTYAQKKPELASIFKTYRDLKANRENAEESSTNGHVNDDDLACGLPSITKRR